jgi:hypothetical protein
MTGGFSNCHKVSWLKHSSRDKNWKSLYISVE